MPTLQDLLAASAEHHNHLCPRQVLGVRLGLFAAELLNLDLPQTDKRLLTIVETDGCAVSGIAVATGCWVRHRTLRVEDYGKVAATFIDTLTETAIRIAPQPAIRHEVTNYAPEAKNRWEAYLLSYQRMPAKQLFRWQEVELKTSLAAILSCPGTRVTCQICNEEIMNEREIVHEGSRLCRACAGQAYYVTAGQIQTVDPCLDRH